MVLDLEEWMDELENKIIRFLIYKKMFTPYEMEEKFSDETIYESSYYNFGIVRNIIKLPNNEIIFKIEKFEREYDDETEENEFYSLNYCVYLPMKDIKIKEFFGDNGGKNE